MTAHKCTWLPWTLALYLLDNTQYFVPALTACFQLYTRSAGVAFFIVGALACSMSVKLLKKVLKQPRPAGRSLKATYGMPSTHSATMSYYATYVCAACIALPSHKSLRSSDQDDTARLATITPVIVVPWAASVILSRVWLGYHTWLQIAVGSGFGAGFATLWFSLWTHGGLNILGNHLEGWTTRLLHL